MRKIEKPFWETTYSEEETAKTFNNGKPSWDVVEVLESRITRGKVLDLGCGDGRNSLYAAELGYDVTAVDISEAGISKLNSLANKQGLNMNSFVQDMRQFSSNELFDVIISHGCLHLVSRGEWINVLKNMKMITKPGGYNVVLVFTDKVPPSPDMEPFFKGLFNEGELYDQYSDWILHHRSGDIFEDDHGGGLRHVHAFNRIISQKPANNSINSGWALGSSET